MSIPQEVLDRDLLVNVVRDGRVGSLRYLTMDQKSPQAPLKHAFLDVETKGKELRNKLYNYSLAFFSN